MFFPHAVPFYLQVTNDTRKISDIDYDDLILRFTVCNPKNPTERAREIEVISSQPVIALTAEISCGLSRLLEEHSCEDAWLFMEGTFYATPPASNSAVDAVQTWLEGCEANSKALLGLSSFHEWTVRSIQQATFREIRPRLGVRYVYVHRGSCQHMLYLTDVRRMHQVLDVMHQSAYPRVVYQSKSRVRKCDVCAVWTARFTVADDKLCETTPCFQCEHCYHMLHYSAGGELLYKDFRVYPYVPDG